MNRQAITFLTLFSLILVLSIYYILLPPENTANQVSLNNQEVSQIEMMQKNLDKEREDLISKNNAIIASSKSNSDEIASALASISEAKETAALEKKITDANSIIKAVMEKTNNEYQVEVKFISETWILSWFYIQ